MNTNSQGLSRLSTAPGIDRSAVVAARSTFDTQKSRLHAIAASVNAGQTLGKIVRLIEETAVEVAGFDRAAVHLVDHGVLHDVASGVSLAPGGVPLAPGGVPLAPGGAPLASGPDPKIDGAAEPRVAAIQALIEGHRPYCISGAPLLQADRAGRPVGSKPLYCAIGLRTAGETIAVLFVDNHHRDVPIALDDVERLLPFCEQVTLALATVRLRAEHERLAEFHRRLGRIAMAISASTALNDILRMVRDAAVEVCGFDRAALYLYDHESGRVQGCWGTDRSGRPEEIAHLSFVPSEEYGWPIWAALRAPSRNVLVADNAAEHRAAPGDPMFDVRALAALPLCADGNTIGVLCVDNLLSNAPIAESDVEALLPFAGQAAIAIQNARLFGRLSQAQEALMRAEKMRAMGELASGVAHNVNNVLTAVLGYSELIQRCGDLPVRAANYARIIERAAIDGADIVRRVQQFARQEAGEESDVFDASTVVREAIDLTRPAWFSQAAAKGVTIRLHTDLNAHLNARGIASEMREVLVNLVRNAADAMPQGGDLTLRCYAQGDRAILQVADTGVGMDEELRRRVFEPFFTTKGPNLGTGLGLSIAWGVVTRHGGEIEVDSAPGRGSVFTVKLPLAMEPAPDAAACGTHSLSGARLLLVEDEELIAESLGRMLTALSADVQIVADGAQALEWLDQNGDACDLLITDHGMAGMTGLELLETVRERYPRIRRVLISGWGHDLPGGVAASAAERILHKPIRLSDISAALLDLLG